MTATSSYHRLISYCTYVVINMSLKNLKYTLNNGTLLPAVGLGTYLLSDDKTVLEAMDTALEVGYRLFDSASYYNNERQIGKALKVLLPKHNLSRKDVFIVTKLFPSDQGDAAADAIETSLRKLDCEYIDLYLIHWPGAGSLAPKDPQNAVLRDLSWQHMVKAVNKGLIKNIGVSNYTVKHLTELIKNNHGIKPVLNQVEWHLQCHQQSLLDFCKEEHIQLQAYMPLGGDDGKDSLLGNENVLNIAEKLGHTPGQILLRWSVQQGVAIIPKSSKKERIISNMELDFNIPEEYMKILSSMKQRKYDWDPKNVF